ncbi:uncharacterized protein [Spinacia oleracea]|uniref:Uncharacterized protein n=1 Tax=Spinacia oleracea TaxID=3562 RepID=A0ABM3R7E5_SPIOL|nr:uncharacterized protein LOC130467094 [Spinacia oleracea]XP_056693336.1 uncharacterized protein LOC130468021 [Spinacia oleracea]
MVGDGSLEAAAMAAHLPFHPFRIFQLLAEFLIAGILLHQLKLMNHILSSNPQFQIIQLTTLTRTRPLGRLDLLRLKDTKERTAKNGLHILLGGVCALAVVVFFRCRKLSE